MPKGPRRSNATAAAHRRTGDDTKVETPAQRSPPATVSSPRHLDGAAGVSLIEDIDNNLWRLLGLEPYSSVEERRRHRPCHARPSTFDVVAHSRRDAPLTDLYTVPSLLEYDLHMIKPFTEELFQQLLAAAAEENAAERRHLLSQHLVIDETMDANIQRDIVLDALYVATDFAMEHKYDYASTAALVEILAVEFISLMDPAYDFNRPPAELVQEMKRLFLEKVQQSHRPVELQTWAEIAEYLAAHILPQRQTFHYMFHNMPIVIDKTVTLCVDTPMRTHLPLSAASSA